MTAPMWLAVMVAFAAVGVLAEHRDRTNTERARHAAHRRLINELERHDP